MNLEINGEDLKKYAIENDIFLIKVENIERGGKNIIEIESKKELESLMKEVKSKGEGVVMYMEYMYRKKDYEVNESHYDEGKMQECIDILKKEIKKYNNKLPKEDDIMMISVEFVFEKIRLIYNYYNEKYEELEEPKEAIATIISDEKFDDFFEVYKKKIDNEKIMEELEFLKKQEKEREPLEEFLEKDEIFAACTTKQARMIHVKKKAIEMNIVEFVNMSKIDLEGFIDYLMTKMKIKDIKK